MFVKRPTDDEQILIEQRVAAVVIVSVIVVVGVVVVVGVNSQFVFWNESQFEFKFDLLWRNPEVNLCVEEQLYSLQQLKNCIKETSFWQDGGHMTIGDPIRGTSVGI